MSHDSWRPYRTSVVAGAVTKLTMFGGYAYDTNTHIGSTANTGRSAVTTLCTSRPGVTHTNHSSASTIPNGGGTVGAVISAARVPSALRTGEATSTTRSVDTATSTLAQTSNRIANANLFGGMIKSGAVHVVASAARNSAGVLTRKATATVGGLTVNGKSQSGTAPANTKIAIPNLGTLWVHRVINTPSGVTVRGLDLILTVTKNGFKKGTEFIIGAANAAASSS